MPKSIDLIKSEKYKDFLACINTDVNKMSDFERFAFVCNNLSLMYGSELRRDFLRFLSEDLDADICADALVSRELQKKLWRRLHGDKNVFLMEMSSSQKEKFSLCVDKNIPIFLNSFFKDGARLPNTLDTFIESIEGDIALDISQFEYLRPDGYHARITYSKMLRRDSCKLDELSALALWVLCRSLMKKDRSVYLLLKENIKPAKAIVTLLEERKLYPRIYMCFRPTEPDVSKAVAELCLSAKEKNISSEIIVPEESKHESFEQSMQKLFELLPLSRVSLCGFLNDALEIKRAERILANLVDQEK